MKCKDIVSLACANLFRRKFRTFMTVLGVIIGTTSIVTMMSLGYGMQRQMISSFTDSTELRQVTVNLKMDGGPADKNDKKLTKEVVEHFRGMDGVELVIPRYSVSVELHFGKYQANTQLYGLDDAGFDFYKFKYYGGHPLERGAVKPAILMGVGVPKTFSAPVRKGNSTYYSSDGEGLPPDINPLTSSCRVKIYNYEAMSGDSSKNPPPEVYQNPRFSSLEIASLVSQKQLSVQDLEAPYVMDPVANSCYMHMDDLLPFLRRYFKGYAIPHEKATRKFKPAGDIWFDDIILLAKDIESAEKLTKAINDEGEYQAYSLIEMMKTVQNSFRIVQLVLGAIGAVSLIVAAIGIANTMMMSIYERTKEIGIFKVLGCSLGNIRNLIISESAGIGFLGGFVGLIFSYALSKLINTLTQNSSLFGGGPPGGTESLGISYIPPLLGLAAFLFAGLIGVMSGLLPAIRAMKLSPLQAIRNE